MTDDGDLTGGSITVTWPWTATATINITNGGTVTSGGVSQSFSQTLSATKTFDFAVNCTPTVTVTFKGYTILSKTYTVQWSQVTEVAPAFVLDNDTFATLFTLRDAAITTAAGVIPTSTTTALAAIGNAINTTTAKVAGYTVFNTTTNKLVTAAGSGASALWKDATGSTAHTPV